MPVVQRGAATGTVPRTPKDLTQAVAEFRRRSSWGEALQLFRTSLQGRLQADGIVYGAAVSACERGSCWQYSLALLAEADELTLDPGIRTLNSALAACGAGNEWCWALHLLDQAQQGLHGAPNVVTYNSAIAAVTKADQWRLGLQLFEQLAHTGLQATEVSFLAGLTACARGEQWEAALGILAMAEETAETVMTMTAGRNAAANACIQAGRWEEGLSVALASPSLDEGSWALAIFACKAGNRWDQALLLLAAMDKASVQPTVAACSAAIASCDRHWEQALQVLAAMQARGPSPNFVVFSAAISACSNASEWIAALGLLEDVRRSSMQVLQRAGAIPAVISSFERSGQWEWVLHVLTACEDMGFHEDLPSLNAAISSLGQRWQRAAELFAGLQAKSLQPDIISLAAVTTSFGTSDRWECVLALGRLIQNRLESNVVSAGATITALQRGSQWESAVDALQRMPQTALQPNIVTCNAGLGAAERGARAAWDQALSLQEKLRRFGQRLDVVSFNSAASVCSLERRWDVALAMLHIVPQAAIEAGLVCCNIAIHACEKVGRWREALRAFAEGATPDIVAFATAIAACASGSRWELVLVLLREMSSEHLEPPVVAYNAAMTACTSAVSWAAALALYSFMQGCHMAPEAAMAALRRLRTQGDLFGHPGLGWSFCSLDSRVIRFDTWLQVTALSGVVECCRPCPSGQHAPPPSLPLRTELFADFFVPQTCSFGISGR
ncbi:unnamed protein product [Symbiodinium sp. CCMP2592]|nr:unnamed protein product [Symbiodinium sp. CCMP2592]